MDTTGRPAPEEVATYYLPYITLAKGTSLVEALEHAGRETDALARRIPAEKGDHRYAEDKWTIKEVIQHVIDAERIFAYRALRFARNDATPLPGFDENEYTPAARAARRTLAELFDELATVRAATISLFASFDQEMLMRNGTANGKTMSVRGLGWTTAGHALHHLRVIEERYLNN